MNVNVIEVSDPDNAVECDDGERNYFHNIVHILHCKKENKIKKQCNKTTVVEIY